MATDAKKHTTIATGENPTRAAIAAALLSISDVVPAATATEQAQIGTALASTAYPVSSSRPLVTTRADARALHQLEVSRDGAVFVPASGVLQFASTGARDTWTSANSALLAAGDACWIGFTEWKWSGTAWRQQGTLAQAFNGTGTAQSFNSTATVLTSLGFSLVIPETMNVRFRLGMQVYTDSLNAGVQLDILDGASSIRTLFGAANGTPGTAGASNTISVEAPIVGMTAGTHVITVRGTRTGSGTLTFPHGSASPSYLIAEPF